MKKFFLSVATTAMASSALAGSLSLDARVDYNSTTYNSEATASDYSKFYMKTGRLDYLGKLNDETSFRVRWSFTKDPNPQKRDSLPQGIEYAYINHKMSENFSLTFGKMASEIGGFEGLTSGADLYLLSEAYTRTDGNSDRIGTMFGTTDVLYMTGVKAAYSFEGQSFSVAGFNPEADDTDAAAKLDQNYSMFGAVYRGAFMEKALQVIASFHEAKSSDDNKNDYYAVGVKWDAAPITASLDYVVTQQKTAADDNHIASIVGKLAYTGMENWIPRLEITSSQSEVASVKNTYMGYGIVAEYVPKKEETFRYHIAANQIKESPDAGDDLERTEIIVGTRLLADFLK